jgi:hypothetical protein
MSPSIHLPNDVSTIAPSKHWRIQIELTFDLRPKGKAYQGQNDYLSTLGLKAMTQTQ